MVYERLNGEVIAAEKAVAVAREDRERAEASKASEDLSKAASKRIEPYKRLQKAKEDLLSSERVRSGWGG